MSDTASKQPEVADQQLPSEKQDEALRYLENHNGISAAEVDAVDLKALRTKIDWHIVPLMFACYFLQFIDKVIINVSNSSHWLSNIVTD